MKSHVRLMIVSVLLSACGGSVSGPPGSSGPPGPQGPPGESPGLLDPAVVSVSPRTFKVGGRYAVDIGIANVTAREIVTENNNVYFSDDNCAIPGFVLGLSKLSAQSVQSLRLDLDVRGKVQDHEVRGAQDCGRMYLLGYGGTLWFDHAVTVTEN